MLGPHTTAVRNRQSLRSPNPGRVGADCRAVQTGSLDSREKPRRPGQTTGANPTLRTDRQTLLAMVRYTMPTTGSGAKTSLGQEIGRASCRERMYIGEDRGYLKKK